MQISKTKQLFHQGEDLAAIYLERKGYAIIGRNFRSARGEIDIIAQTPDCLVFAEVKTRSRHSIKLALMNIGYTKRKRLTLTAKHYLDLHPEHLRPQIRFDVIVLLHYSDTDSYHIEHFTDAFTPVFDDD